MKNHFSLKRFALLFRKHTAENYRSYLMSLVVLIGILALVLGLASYLSSGPLNQDFQAMLFAMFLLGTGTVFTSTVFSNLGERNKAIPYLTLPASALEKYLVAWAYSYPLFLLVFSVFFYLVAGVMIGMDTRGEKEAELVSLFAEDKKLYMVFLVYAFLHSIVLVGAIFFKKGHFTKTAFIGFVGFFLLFTLNRQFLEAILGRDILLSSYPFGDVKLVEDEQLYTLAIPDQQLLLLWWLPILMAALLWATAFFKLKEKQV